jgi:predicted nucleotidyltransferase
LGPNSSSIIKRKVAKEAASLLYFGVEKEYKQAKLRAAKTLGVHFLPTNLEVAIEFDKIVEENEGNDRQKRLIRMRQEAPNLIKVLKAYNPVLVGSVWRGTIYHESDIDILVHHDEPEEILKTLKQNNFKVLQTEWIAVTKEGQRRTSFHIHLELPSKEKAEITVRSLEEAKRKERCEIYGDIITGLPLQDLERVLMENPTQRFVPF